MASIYKRARSPFWWVKYIDPLTGRLIQESTLCRHAVPAETRRARDIARTISLREIKRPRSVITREKWSEWVRPFIDASYLNPRSRRVFLGMWRTLEQFLTERGIPSPRHLERPHCFAYIEWRTALGFITAPSRPISRNRVLDEIKFLRHLMNEAVVRGYSPSNPCSNLRLRAAPRHERPALTEWQITTIKAALDERLGEAESQPDRDLAEAMRVSFLIALAQGFRLTETWFPLEAVDFKAGHVTVLAKGGKFYTAPLNPTLTPVLQEFKDAGRVHTFVMPPRLSLVWSRFFKALRARHPGQFEGVSFHSTRVTVISRLAQAGAPEAVVMKLVNHSSATVHRIYRRIGQGELDKFWAAVPVR